MSFLNLAELKENEPVPGFKVRFVHSENMTIAYWEIRAGSVLPPHSHLHEQVTNIIEGEFELSINEKTNLMRANTVAIVPPNAPHAGRAMSDCRIIDVFYPVREDYR